MAFENDAASYMELSLHESGRETCRKDKEFTFTPKEYHLFHYVTVGRGIFEMNGTVYKIRKGMIFYIPPGARPYYYPDPAEPWTYEWFGFNGIKAESFLKLSGISEQHPVYDDVNMDLKPFFDAISTEYAETGSLNLFCLGQAYSLFGRLFAEAVGPSLNIREAHLQSAKEYIHNNYKFRVTVEEVASNVGISPNYLASLFKEYENSNTKAYLTQVRMEKAAELLRLGNYPIKDVAALVGYKNQLHFSGEFRKYYGMSPTSFQSKEKGKENL